MKHLSAVLIVVTFATVLTSSEYAKASSCPNPPQTSNAIAGCPCATIGQTTMNPGQTAILACLEVPGGTPGDNNVIWSQESNSAMPYGSGGGGLTGGCIQTIGAGPDRCTTWGNGAICNPTCGSASGSVCGVTSMLETMNGNGTMGTYYYYSCISQSTQ